MSPLEIRIALLRKGYNNTKVGRDLGLVQTTVSNVIHGYGYSARVAAHISKITGIQVSVLFPGRQGVSTRHAA